MIRRRRAPFVLAATALGAGLLSVTNLAPAGAATDATGDSTYVVLASTPADVAAAEAAVTAAGGTVTGTNTAIGLVTARAASTTFTARVRSAAGVAGVAADRTIGEAPARDDEAAAEVKAARSEGRSGGGDHKGDGKAGEPFADLQWDMKMIGATPEGSYDEEQGNRKVTVGIIDTGVDGTHPDLKPNFSKRLSRNFVKDIESIDGPCEFASCIDPVDHDDDGHGTHVAGTIGAALNGIGIGGVAPKVTLVNVRAGQDSGYFFLAPTVNALTYAGDAGIDVVNMSFFVDPWLFNCPNNPADSAEEQAEQRTIISAMTRALRYAKSKGVTLVAALGNSHFNYDDITGITDEISPDFPGGTERPRAVQADCLDLPVMGDGVIGTISVGPSGKKADYSNWGLTYGEVSAPGGFFRDFAGTPQNRTPGNLILSPLPKNVGIDLELIDPVTGDVLDDTGFTLKSCKAGVCGYYQYLQGTSMASPHAAGVAALIVSEYGEDQRGGGFGMNPDKVARILFKTATDVACPAPVITYTAEGRPASYNAACVGTAERNTIYGNGIVNAARAVDAD